MQNVLSGVAHSRSSEQRLNTTCALLSLFDQMHLDPAPYAIAPSLQFPLPLYFAWIKSHLIVQFFVGPFCAKIYCYRDAKLLFHMIVLKDLIAFVLVGDDVGAGIVDVQAPALPVQDSVRVVASSDAVWRCAVVEGEHPIFVDHP